MGGGTSECCQLPGSPGVVDVAVGENDSGDRKVLGCDVLADRLWFRGDIDDDGLSTVGISDHPRVRLSDPSGNLFDDHSGRGGVVGESESAEHTVDRAKIGKKPGKLRRI